VQEGGVKVMRRRRRRRAMNDVNFWLMESPLGEEKQQY
jgi:hypothetical protein